MSTGRIFDDSATTKFTLELIRQAKTHLDQVGAPKGKDNRTILLDAVAMQQLLRDPIVTDIDRNRMKPLVDGDVDHFMGFTFVTIEDREEGGLPGLPADKVAFAYHKMSIGIAYGFALKTEINYIPLKTSWLVNGLFRAGAVDRQAQGIVKMQYNETI